MARLDPFVDVLLRERDRKGPVAVFRVLPAKVVTVEAHRELQVRAAGRAKLIEPDEAYVKSVEKAGIASALKAKGHKLTITAEP